MAYNVGESEKRLLPRSQHETRRKVEETIIDNHDATQVSKEDLNTEPIGAVLRIGSTISLIIMALSLFWLALTPDGLHTTNFPYKLPDILFGLIQFHPQAYLVLGVLLLICVPVFRIIVSLFAFAKVRDYRFVIIGLITLTILCIAFLLGKQE